MYCCRLYRACSYMQSSMVYLIIVAWKFPTSLMFLLDHQRNISSFYSIFGLSRSAIRSSVFWFDNSRFTSIMFNSFASFQRLRRNSGCRRVYKLYSDDLPFPQTFHQEIALWKTMWKNSPIKPNSLVTTIADRNASAPTILPNITTIIKLLLLTSVTSSGVERANSSLRFI